MATWYAKNLGDPLLAGEALETLKARFQADYVQAGRPHDMALFMRHESERVHCEVRVYLTPAAAAVARAIDAEPCPPPKRQGLDLLIGAPEAWSLFPHQD